MVGYEPLVGEHIRQIVEHYVDANRIHHGWERFRHIDVRVVGQRRLLRERRDHRDIVSAGGQCLHQALVHHPVATAVNWEHAENVGTIDDRQCADRRQKKSDELHLQTI